MVREGAVRPASRKKARPPGRAARRRSPAARGAGTPAARPPKGPKAGKRPRRPRVLIVDDEAPIRQALQLALERGPFDVQVTTAADGMEAIDHLARRGADVVVADLKMPKMDGMALLREVRTRQPETYFIMMTGFSTIETAVEALKLGAMDYITKPHLETELVRSVQAVLEEIHFKEGFKVRKGNVEARTGGAPEKLATLVAGGLRPILIVPDADPDAIGYSRSGGVLLLTRPPPRDAPAAGEYCNPHQLVDLARRVVGLVEERASCVFLRGLHHLIALAGENDTKTFIASVAAAVFAADGELLLSLAPGELPPRILDEVQETITSAYYGAITKVISTGVTHPIRRMVVGLLSKHGTLSFSYLQDALGVGKPPKLSFHLARLREDHIVEQDGEKRYLLTRRGQKVAHILDQIGRREARLDSDIIYQEPVPGAHSPSQPPAAAHAPAPSGASAVR